MSKGKLIIALILSDAVLTLNDVVEGYNTESSGPIPKLTRLMH